MKTFKIIKIFPYKMQSFIQEKYIYFAHLFTLEGAVAEAMLQLRFFTVSLQIGNQRIKSSLFILL